MLPRNGAQSFRSQYQYLRTKGRGAGAAFAPGPSGPRVPSPNGFHLAGIQLEQNYQQQQQQHERNFGADANLGGLQGYNVYAAAQHILETPLFSQLANLAQQQRQLPAGLDLTVLQQSISSLRVSSDAASYRQQEGVGAALQPEAAARLSAIYRPSIGPGWSS